MFVRLC